MTHLEVALKYCKEIKVQKVVTAKHEYNKLRGPILWDDIDKEYKFYNENGILILNVREAMVEATYFNYEED